MTKKQLKCYYLLLIRHYKLSLLNQFLEGYSVMAAWGSYFFFKKKKILFFYFSALLKCHWLIWASSLKSHLPAGRIYSPLATGRVLMKRLRMVSELILCICIYVTIDAMLNFKVDFTVDANSDITCKHRFNRC